MIGSGGAGSGSAGRACSLAVCPADDGVACLTSTNQLVQLAVSSADRKGVFSGMQQLAPGFHAGEISGLATCCRRPIVATAGSSGAGGGDRTSTLRIWNYRDRCAELVRCAAVLWVLLFSMLRTSLALPCTALPAPPPPHPLRRCRSSRLQSPSPAWPCTPAATCCWPALPTGCAS